MVTKEEKQHMAHAVEEVLALYDVQLQGEERLKAGEIEGYELFLEKTRKKIGELKEKADAILKKSGMTEEQLKAYISNRANFSPKEWEMLEQTREKCKKMEEKSERILEKNIPSEIMQKIKDKPLQKTKARRTVRRKDWIPT